MQQIAPTNATLPTPPAWFEALADSLAIAVVDRVRKEFPTPRSAPQPAAPQTRSPYATVEEAATFLRCKPQRIYDLISGRVLRRFKDGARVLILWSDLEMHVTARERIAAGARRVNGYA